MKNNNNLDIRNKIKESLNDFIYIIEKDTNEKFQIFIYLNDSSLIEFKIIDDELVVTSFKNNKKVWRTINNDEYQTLYINEAEQDGIFHHIQLKNINKIKNNILKAIEFAIESLN